MKHNTMDDWKRKKVEVEEIINALDRRKEETGSLLNSFSKRVKGSMYQLFITKDREQLFVLEDYDKEALAKAKDELKRINRKIETLQKEERQHVAMKITGGIAIGLIILATFTLFTNHLHENMGLPTGAAVISPETAPVTHRFLSSVKNLLLRASDTLTGAFTIMPVIEEEEANQSEDATYNGTENDPSEPETMNPPSMGIAGFGPFAAPAVDTLILNTTNPLTNDTNQNLTAYNTTSDTDGDSVKVIYNWYKDGTSIMVLNMPFENNTANVSNSTRDYSGFENNGTVVNATWSASGGYDGGGAYEFDGADSVITIPSDASISNVFYNGGSISAWVYPRSDGEGDAGRIFQKSLSGSGWFVRVSADDGSKVKFRLEQNFDDTDGIWNCQSTELLLNAWNHIAIVYNSSSADNDAVLYANGQAVTLSIFSNRRISILESLVSYLRDEEKLTLIQIAKILNKAYGTIKTVYWRYNKKCH